uniref:Uncharacterized protein n=1 Tax=Rhizophora mucronata TaxID=61149 RepID=A0A2P2LX40_RHIMU
MGPDSDYLKPCLAVTSDSQLHPHFFSTSQRRIERENAVQPLSRNITENKGTIQKLLPDKGLQATS